MKRYAQVSFVSKLKLRNYSKIGPSDKNSIFFLNLFFLKFIRKKNQFSLKISTNFVYQMFPILSVIFLNFPLGTSSKLTRTIFGDIFFYYLYTNLRRASMYNLLIPLIPLDFVLPVTLPIRFGAIFVNTFYNFSLFFLSIFRPEGLQS